MNASNSSGNDACAMTLSDCGALPKPRSNIAVAAETLALAFKFTSFKMLTRAAIASSVCARASTAISSSRFGRPEGFRIVPARIALLRSC